LLLAKNLREAHRLLLCPPLCAAHFPSIAYDAQNSFSMAWHAAFSAYEQGDHMATVERYRKLEAV
jgi:hypothetical protein